MSTEAAIGCLTIRNGGEVGKRFPLKELTVFEGGRSQGHHVHLRHPSVAMSHFRIYRAGEEYTLHDLGSSKGTHVNGEPVEKAVLHPGDIVKVGEIELEFQYAPGSTPGEVVASAPQAALGLVVLDGKDKGRTFVLSGKDKVRIGRSVNVEFKLADGKVSREHCQLETVRDHHIIIDLESSNGTVVNGERVKKTVLKEGDCIRLGFTVLRYDRV